MTDNTANSEIQNNNSNNLEVGAKGGAIAFGLKVFATLLGFLNQIAMARLLGASGVGEVILAVTVVRIAVQIAKFGMEETMMKFVPIYIDRNDSSRLKGTIYFALKFCLLVSLFLVFLIIGTSRFISIDIFDSEGLLKLLPLIAVALPLWVVRDVIGGILRGHKEVLKSLIPEMLVSPVFRLGIFLFLVLWGASPMDAIIAFVIGEVLAVMTSIVFLKRAYTIIFTSMSILLYTQADIWILGMYMPTNIVGIYGIVAKLVLLVYFPMLAFSAIVPPLIASIHASGNIDEFREMVSKSTRWILSIAMPIILLLMLEGKYILGIFYGPEFSAGYTALVILTSGQLVKAFAGLIAGVMMMTGEHKIYMKVTILWGILNIALSVLLVSRYGMIGVAAATAFSLAMVDIICIFIIKKRLSVLTLAKGMRFDVVFIVLVTVFYLIIYYSGYSLLNHVLLAISLAVYLWKTIANHDIPWRLLVVKDNKES
jgi:O-antigen/teichoic acid export membrane protein